MELTVSHEESSANLGNILPSEMLEENIFLINNNKPGSHYKNATLRYYFRTIIGNTFQNSSQRTVELYVFSSFTTTTLLKSLSRTVKLTSKPKNLLYC